MKSLKHVMNASSSRETKGEDIKALIVTAHPDDECMFFAPTIIGLVDLNASVHLLCLSEGTMTAPRAYITSNNLCKERIINYVAYC